MGVVINTSGDASSRYPLRYEEQVSAKTSGGAAPCVASVAARVVSMTNSVVNVEITGDFRRSSGKPDNGSFWLYIGHGETPKIVRVAESSGSLPNELTISLFRADMIAVQQRIGYKCPQSKRGIFDSDKNMEKALNAYVINGIIDFGGKWGLSDVVLRTNLFDDSLLGMLDYYPVGFGHAREGRLIAGIKLYLVANGWGDEVNLDDAHWTKWDKHDDAALKVHQAYHGLPQTGICNGETFRSLVEGAYYIEGFFADTLDDDHTFGKGTNYGVWGNGNVIYVNPKVSHTFAFKRPDYDTPLNIWVAVDGKASRDPRYTKSVQLKNPNGSVFTHVFASKDVVKIPGKYTKKPSAPTNVTCAPTKANGNTFKVTWKNAASKAAPCDYVMVEAVNESGKPMTSGTYVHSGTSATISVPVNSKFKVRVTAYNKMGSASSMTSTWHGSTVPTPKVYARRTGTDAISVVWDSNGLNSSGTQEKAHTVNSKMDAAGTWEAVPQLTGLSYGYHRFRLTNVLGEAKASAVSPSVLIADRPVRPESVSWNIDGDMLSLKWVPNETKVAPYDYVNVKCSNDGNVAGAKPLTVTGDSCSLKLADNGRYDVMITPGNLAGNGTSLLLSPVYSKPVPPSVYVETIVETRFSAANARLTIGRRSLFSNKAVIQRSDANGSWRDIATVSFGDKQSVYYVDEGGAGDAYYRVCEVVDRDGQKISSDWSPVSRKVVLDAPPKGLEYAYIVDDGMYLDNTVTIKFKPASGSVTRSVLLWVEKNKTVVRNGHVEMVSTEESITCQLKTKESDGSFSYRYDSIEPDTFYRFELMACNNAGRSFPIVGQTILAYLGTPTLRRSMVTVNSTDTAVGNNVTETALIIDLSRTLIPTHYSQFPLTLILYRTIIDSDTGAVKVPRAKVSETSILPFENDMFEPLVVHDTVSKSVLGDDAILYGLSFNYPVGALGPEPRVDRYAESPITNVPTGDHLQYTPTSVGSLSSSVRHSQNDVTSDVVTLTWTQDDSATTFDVFIDGTTRVIHDNVPDSVTGDVLKVSAPVFGDDGKWSMEMAWKRNVSHKVSVYATNDTGSSDPANIQVHDTSAPPQNLIVYHHGGKWNVSVDIDEANTLCYNMIKCEYMMADDPTWYEFEHQMDANALCYTYECSKPMAFRASLIDTVNSLSSETINGQICHIPTITLLNVDSVSSISLMKG